MKWGDRGEKGCKGSCNLLHPQVCPASLKLRCTKKNCEFKLHVSKCKRNRGGTVIKKHEDYSAKRDDKEAAKGPKAPLCCSSCEKIPKIFDGKKGSGSANDHSVENMGFQMSTVQPMLEALVGKMKEEMQQKQDLMLQAIRMEIMQARPPFLRSPYSLPHSY